MSDVLPREVRPVTAVNRLSVRAAVGVARLLAKAPPGALRAVLDTVARGTRQADYAAVQAARDMVLTVDAFSRGGSACLPRSIATALICRTRGVWPDWCVGVLSAPPFTAHAWVEAEGRIVGEPMDGSDFSRLFTVSAAHLSPAVDSAA